MAFKWFKCGLHCMINFVLNRKLYPSKVGILIKYLKWDVYILTTLTTCA